MRESSDSRWPIRSLWPIRACSPIGILASLLLIVGLARASLSIVVPELLDIEFYRELMDAEKQRGNRSLMTNEVISDYDRRRDVSRSLACIDSFFDRYFEYPDRIAFFVARSLQAEVGLAEHFIRHLRRDLVTFVVDDGLERITAQNTSGNAVILIDEPTDLGNMSYYLFHLCSRDCFFAVIFMRSFADEKVFLQQTDEMVQVMWTHSVGNVVMIGSVNDAVVMAGSVSYKKNDTCGPAKAVFIDRCVGKAWKSEHTLKPWPLNECLVKVAFFKNPPYSVENNSTGEVRHEGIESTMIQEIIYSMDGKLLLEEIEWSTNSDTYNEIRNRLDYEAGFDIVYGGILWSPTLDVDYTVCYELVQIVWVVPLLANVSLEGLVGAFGPMVWLAIVVTFIFGGIIKTFLIKDISGLDMVGLVIGVSASRQPKRLSTRLNFISWTIFGFLICQFYLDKLAAVLMSQANLGINTIHELIDTEFKLGGTARFANFFDVIDEDDDDDEEDLIIENIRARFKVFDQDEYVRRLADLEAGRNSTWALLVMLNVSTSKPENIETHSHMMGDSMGSYPLAMAVWRGLPYLSEIDFKIQLLKQVGLVQYWGNRYTLRGNYFKHTEEEEEDDNLALEELAPGFLLLMIGHILAFLTLIAEIVFHPSKWLE